MKYKWSIFLVNLDPSIGSEQGKTRPVLIISEDDLNNILPVVNILPITSLKTDRKVYANEVKIQKEDSGLNKDSIVLCYQIRTIDKQRIIKKIGEITDPTIMIEVNNALSFQLGL
jgi:mRNA interferase MazF